MPRVRRIALRQREADPLADLLAGATGPERVIRFVEHLRHSKGEWAGKHFELLPFQREIIRGLFGPVTPSGHRRIRNGLVFIPRKNGKTTLAAGLGLYGTFCDGPGARVVVAANSREQAGELFTAAADAVESSEILSRRAVLSRAQKRITDRVTRSTLKVISADAPTAHGMDLSMWIYDELHGAPNRELYDVLQTSGGARRESLGLAISTAGFDKLSILGELYDHTKRWIADPSIDPSFYGYVCEAGESDAWDDERTWHKANPALGVFRNIDEMRVLAERAKQVPSQIDAFKRLYLNVWTSAESTWLDMAAWDGCGDDIDDAALADVQCYGGLDLSATTDLTAFVLLFPFRGRIYVRHWAWLPADGIIEREHRDRVPYRQWAKQGRIELIAGQIIDHRVVTARIIELSRRYRIESVMFDRWGAIPVYTELADAGIMMAQMGQGFQSMSAPTKELQKAVLSGALAHGGCPLLRWQASCATVASDPAGNIKLVKPDRLRYARRIDSLVAAVMALDRLMRMEAQGSIDSFLAEPLII